MRLKMNYVSIHYLNGSASVPSFGRLFGLFALGHPERLPKNRVRYYWMYSEVQKTFYLLWVE